MEYLQCGIRPRNGSCNPLYLLNLRQTFSVGVQDIENRAGSGPGSVNTGVPLGHKATSGSLAENSGAHICVSWRQ